MEQDVFQTRFMEFVTPSGHHVKIREQNGADDDVLSNPVEAASLLNISRFISGIVVEADYNESKKITVDQAQGLPALDRYCILFQSRIFSLGEILEFEYDWGENGGKVSYEQDLREFLFDYSSVPTEEELDAKPNAIPFYPEPGKLKDIHFVTESGKELAFDLMTARGESWVANLPLEKQTKNQIYVARDLRLKVGDKFEKVTNFSMFSMKDMRDIRTNILTHDPIFMGITSIENPTTKQTTEISVVALPGFFYPGEI